ncbi:MAG: ABC transporter ATP-binding protein, partial [Rhizobiaceae bacterium]|nr:ABC transporter ATP-binding protein [Rhizobiaceae bacterium]
FLFVTHDQVEAMSMGDRIGVLDRGRLVQVGTPAEIYDNPRNTFVARSVGSPPMNLLDGAIAGGEAVTDVGFRLPVAARGHGAAGDRPLTFGIRPEDVYLDPAAPAQAQVHDVENHGVAKIVTLRVGEQLVRVTASARQSLAIDDAVRFAWNPEKVVLFDRASGVSLRHGA